MCRATSFLFAAIAVATHLISCSVVATSSISTTTSSESFGPSQPRYWPKYGGNRVVTLLDGIWQTGQLGSIDHPPPKSFDSMDPSLHPSDPIAVTPNTTAVPSCVDNAPPGYLGYRGVTFFRTHFDYDLTKAPARLQFQACSFYCRVWVNGVEIGDHRAGGYVAFALDVPQQEQQEQTLTERSHEESSSYSPSLRSTPTKSTKNELVVLVDNRFNKTRAPTHENGDYWHYSGIMRSVELHTMPSQPKTVWPWRLYVLPQSLSTVKLTLYLTNPSFSGEVSGHFAFGGDVKGKSFTGHAKDGIVELGIHKVPKPRVWSIGKPELHTVSINVNGAAVTERFGLRQFSVDEATSRIMINGEVVKLVGWNHHTQWPKSAASPTDQEMDDDIALLQQGGTNYVRGSHYPQDPRWLDRLDEAGMVMWCETLGAGVDAKDTIDPYFMKYQTQQLNEMMDAAMNHAAIMLWAFFNEGPSEVKDACIGYETCAKVIKERDSTRLVTWASNKMQRDVCLHAADVVSFNNYPGWYGRGVDPAEFWNKHANNVKSGKYPGSLGKPLLISETGAAGIYEWAHNKTSVRWSLAYQSKVIAQDVDVAIQNANISGITLWHFMDFKTFDNTENNTHCDYIPDEYPPTCAYINASDGIRRPGGLNHKGVVDFWRRKKPIFDIVASKYNATRYFKDAEVTME